MVVAPVPDIKAFQHWVESIQPEDHFCQNANSISMTAVQSHYDDFALSSIGTALQVCGKLLLHTTHSLSDHTTIRQNEDACIGNLIPTRVQHDGLSECSGRVPCSSIGATVGIVIGPAAVGRHVDHIATSEIAENKQAIAFWEDVAFWGIYGLSVDDRMHFSLLRREWLANKCIVAIPIDPVIETKIRILSNYPSQSTDVWRPIRYAWTAAREVSSDAYFVERFFIDFNDLAKFGDILGLRLSNGGEIVYGMHKIKVVHGDWLA